MAQPQYFQIVFLKDSNFIYKTFDSVSVSADSLLITLKISSIQSDYKGPQSDSTSSGTLKKVVPCTELGTCQVVSDIEGNSIYTCINRSNLCNPCNPYDPYNPSDPYNPYTCGQYYNPYLQNGCDSCEPNPDGFNPGMMDYCDDSCVDVGHIEGCCQDNACGDNCGDPEKYCDEYGVEYCVDNTCVDNPCNPCEDNGYLQYQQFLYQQQLNDYYSQLRSNDPTYNYLLTNPSNLSYPYTNNCNQYINPYTNVRINLPDTLIDNCINSPYLKNYSSQTPSPTMLSSIKLEIIFSGSTLNGKEVITLNNKKTSSEINNILIKTGLFPFIINKVKVNYKYSMMNGIPVWTITGGEIDFTNLLLANLIQAL